MAHAGWRPMGSIDEVREGTPVRIIADEGALETRMNRTAAGATGKLGYASGHAGKEGKIRKRTNAGNAKVEFGGGGTCLFPWDALMVDASPSQARRTLDRKLALGLIAVIVALWPAISVALENGGSCEHFLQKLPLCLFTGVILQALCIIYDIISFAIVQIGRLCGWLAASVRSLGRWMANCAASKNPEGSLRRLLTNDADREQLHLGFFSLVGDKGATELAGALRDNTVLTQLSLPGVNFVGDRGATELAGALRNNTVLTQLQLGVNFVGEQGAAALAAALRDNTVLTQLRLPRVNCKGRREVEAACAENQSVKELKAMLDAWQVDYSDCVKKSDLEAKVTARVCDVQSEMIEILEVRTRGDWRQPFKAARQHLEEVFDFVASKSCIENAAVCERIVRRMQQESDQLQRSERKLCDLQVQISVASKAGQSIASLQQIRKQAWQQCLDLTVKLSNLRSMGEEVRSQAGKKYKQVVARQVPYLKPSGAKVEGVGTMEDVQRIMTEANDAFKEWKNKKVSLAEKTDESFAILTTGPLNGVRTVPPARIQDVREAVEIERQWYAFGWWQESRHCEERINAYYVALTSVLSRLQTTFEVCCDAATKAKIRTLPFEEALKDPHEELLHKMRGVKQVLKEAKQTLMEAKHRAEIARVKVQDEDLEEKEEAEAEATKAEAEVEANLLRLQKCLRSHRQNLAEVFRLSSLFPELPDLVKARGPDGVRLVHKSHLTLNVFTDEPEVAALLEVDREYSHYSIIKALSRTPESRHDVDHASFDGQDVALKKFNIKSESLKTLRTELVMLSCLKHPNIIPVNLFIEDLAHGCVYVEFPLYDQDMEAWLKTAPSYPDVHASVHDILRAIEHMHRARVVHCDIRPKNILMKQRVGVADADGVTGKWQATLADFDVSLNSGARATIWQTRTEGPRGFDGMLTMAPELRAPFFQGCTPASDMFSFGGLLYVALYPQISPAMVKTSGNGDIEVGAHENDVDVAPLVRSLLQKDSKDRPSASEALAHPLFATAGANLLAQVQEQQRELARLHEDNRREEEEAKRRLAEKRRKVQEDERKLEQKQERLQQDSSALRHKDRQQQEKERQLREDRESVRREKAKLKEDQEREEIAQRKRQELLDKKEKKLQHEQQKLEKGFLTPPQHWTSSRGAASAGKPLLFNKVRDDGVKAVLQELLNGTGIGSGGRDQQQPGRYSRLELAGAWRVENHDLYSAYKVTQRRVLTFAGKVAVRGDSKARIRNELYASASKLPGDLEKGCNEVRLLHGTKPELVLSIAQQGMNERFAGASAGTAFGDGSYFADDAGKIDQYVREDVAYNDSWPLHQRLYNDSRHPGKVFYAFVFRVTLGHSVKYAERKEQCFNPNTNRRELQNIPHTGQPYHSLVAAGIRRYNEYVIFHSDQTYPEYLLAFHRR